MKATTREPHQLARTQDMFTSHKAAREHVESGQHQCQQDVVKDLLRRHPRRTYRELFRVHSLEYFERGQPPVFLDAPSLMRRLSEVGVAVGHAKDRVTQRTSSTWELAEKNE